MRLNMRQYMGLIYEAQDEAIYAALYEAIYEANI